MTKQEAIEKAYEVYAETVMLQTHYKSIIHGFNAGIIWQKEQTELCIKKLKTEIKELKNVLKWYADKKSYEPSFVWSESEQCLQSTGITENVEIEQGKRAREILEKIKI
jgi:hypothetical protein